MLKVPGRINKDSEVKNDNPQTIMFWTKMQAL